MEIETNDKTLSYTNILYNNDLTTKRNKGSWKMNSVFKD